MGSYRSPSPSRTESSKGWDGTALGLAAKSSLGKMMALGGEIHARVPVAGLDLAEKQKVPKITNMGCH